jgi:hypothetical protein
MNLPVVDYLLFLYHHQSQHTIWPTNHTESVHHVCHPLYHFYPGPFCHSTSGGPHRSSDWGQIHFFRLAPSINTIDQDKDRMVGERDPQLQNIPSARTVYSRKMTELGGPGSAAGLAWHPTEEARQTFRDSYGFERSKFDGLPRYMHPS